MTINPETLKHLRKAQNLTPAKLAEKTAKHPGAPEGVTSRTIRRIEGGEVAPERVRSTTIQRLADALGFKDKPEILAGPPSTLAEREHDEKLRSVGYRKIKSHIPGRAALSFALAERRYGVPAQSQIELAPLCFTILAEMSLAARRRRLSEFDAAHEAYRAALPAHLECVHAIAALEDVYRAEKHSIDAHDLFGIHFLEAADERHFDPDASNPFLDFLRDTIRDLEMQGGEEIAKVNEPDGAGLPDTYHTQVLPSLLDRITGGDRHARAALEDGHVRIRDIPPDLWEETQTPDRAAWLGARLPAEKRQLLDIEIDL